MVMLRFGILQNVYNLFKDLRKTNSLINVILQYQATLCFKSMTHCPSVPPCNQQRHFLDKFLTSHYKRRERGGKKEERREEKKRER